MVSAINTTSVTSANKPPQVSTKIHQLNWTNKIFNSNCLYQIFSQPEVAHNFTQLRRCPASPLPPPPAGRPKPHRHGAAPGARRRAPTLSASPSCRPPGGTKTHPTPHNGVVPLSPSLHRNNHRSGTPNVVQSCDWMLVSSCAV